MKNSKSRTKTITKQLSQLKGQFDKLEGHSRRNNIRINGIHGSLNEDWSVSESKVRDLIKNDLDMPDMEYVDSERAHRVKSHDINKCTILVKFQKYNDCVTIMEKAHSVHTRGSRMSVRPDYTDRVARHRRVMGD